MNSPNDCLLCVSRPLGRCMDSLWTLEKGYEQSKWLFAFCFWALGQRELVFGPLGKGMNSSIDGLLSVSGLLGKVDLILDPWERV